MTATMDASAGIGMTPEQFQRFAAGAPEGYRVEQINGEVYVTPPAGGDHDINVAEIASQILAHHGQWWTFENRGLMIKDYRNGHSIPDGVVVDSRRAFAGQPEWADASPVLALIEVTSSGHEDQDRIGKRDAYARAGIGMYLLVDRQRREVTVFSAPEDDRYGDVHTVPYGKPLALPEPLVFTLDTSSLV
ncbi:Uma2 family endonuclease [Nonomuraea sp. NPDC050536]|uniref:Uma2 family endonuclease n=1 Tax=Nonomuraea sp. NPDC050536 TaxID=3364366 RepID=UPI0037C66E17